MKTRLLLCSALALFLLPGVSFQAGETVAAVAHPPEDKAPAVTRDKEERETLARPPSERSPSTLGAPSETSGPGKSSGPAQKPEDPRKGPP